MRVLGALALNLFLNSSLIPAQSNSPKEVVEAYRKMDARGERLTASGWYKASKFFVKPARPPQRHVLGVMFGEEIDGTRITGNRAEVSLVRSALGQIDAFGRFTSVVMPRLLDPFGRVSRQTKEAQIHGLASIAVSYTLILTDTYWESGPKEEGPREVKGPAQWRLEYFEHEAWVVKDVAIRYLTKLRDESSSKAIQGNSEKSIASLVGAR